MHRIFFDTETFPIGPGDVFPRAVCCSIAYEDGQETQLIGDDVPINLWVAFQALLAPGHLLVGHNVAYDCQVICTTFPDLIPRVWAKYEAGEVVDTLLREKLLNLATHGGLTTLYLPDGSALPINYGLADLVLKYTGRDRSAEKEDPNGWRLNYRLLSGRPVKSWPEEAQVYPKLDAEDTRDVFNEQEQMPGAEDAFVTQAFQARKDFGLAWATRPGMRTDRERVIALKERLDKDYADENFPELIRAGILRPGSPARPHKKRPTVMVAATKSTVDTKALQAAVEKACHEIGLEPKRTPTGGVARGYDEVMAVAAGRPPLLEYVRREEERKLISTEVPRMMWGDAPAPVVHFAFNALVSTGRTSSRANDKYPSANGQNVDPRARGCYVPRPDMLFCSADFKSLELVTVAQRMLDLFGWSKHAEKINAGYDLHKFLGSRLLAFLNPAHRPAMAGMNEDERYSYMGGLEGTDKSTYKKWRTFAKPVGLGNPGGLGSEKFITFALGDAYKVDIVQESQAHIGLLAWGSNVHHYAGRMRLVDPKSPWRDPTILVSGFDPDDAATWPRHLQGIGLAALLKKLWLETYPEMVEYFRRVPTWRDTQNEREGAAPLFYVSPLGMLRRNADFCAAANGFAMQTPGAEAATDAQAVISRACTDRSMGSVLFGCNPVDFVHDECIVEVWEDRAHEQAMEIKRIMEASLQRICPDVRVEANPALMRRWDKFAEPFYVDGQLVPWDDRPVKAA